MSRDLTGLLLILAVVVLPLSGRAQREVRLASPAELAKAVKEARPGDVLLLPDGTYADTPLQFSVGGPDVEAADYSTRTVPPHSHGVSLSTRRQLDFPPAPSASSNAGCDSIAAGLIITHYQLTFATPFT